jgi:hypothetical protein
VDDYSLLARFCANDEQTRVIEALAQHPEETYHQIGLRLGKTRSAVESIVKRVRRKAKAANVDPTVTEVTDISVEAHLRQQVAGLQAQCKQLREHAADTVEIKQIIHEFKNMDRAEPEWIGMEMPDKDSTGTPTIFFSDLHYGERVYRDQVQGANSYDIPTAKRRIEATIDKAFYLLFDRIARPNYDGVVFPLGGDMVSGTIHEEITHTNDLLILEQVYDLYQQLIMVIDRLKDAFGRVFVPAVTGNHGRLSRKPKMKNAAKDNYEWILYQFLSAYYKDDPAVTFKIGDGFDVQYRVHGHTYLLTHGDRAFRGGTGITGPLLPWMRGTQKKQRVYDAIDMPFDTILMGHWHSLNFLLSYGMIINGSLKGYDEYAMSNGFEFQEPAQAMWITSRKGNIWYPSAIYPDWDNEKENQPWVEI